jgi:hypothetical protein
LQNLLVKILLAPEQPRCQEKTRVGMSPEPNFQKFSRLGLLAEAGSTRPKAKAGPRKKFVFW